MGRPVGRIEDWGGTLGGQVRHPRVAPLGGPNASGFQLSLEAKSIPQAGRGLQGVGAWCGGVETGLAALTAEF
jgi:hypothetical protein